MQPSSNMRNMHRTGTWRLTVRCKSSIPRCIRTPSCTPCVGDGPSPSVVVKPAGVTTTAGSLGWPREIIFFFAGALLGLETTGMTKVAAPMSVPDCSCSVWCGEGS